MSFAYIKYGEKDINNPVEKFFTKHFGKGKTTPFKGLEDIGVEVVMPFKKEEKDICLRQGTSQRTFKALKKAGVDTIAAEDFINTEYGFVKSDGAKINAAFAEKIFKWVIERNDIDIKNAEVIVKDGGDKNTQEVILKIAPMVTQLGINTQRKNQMEGLIEKIYAESGLSIYAFADEYSKSMKNADVIINCQKTKENNKCYKKNAVWLYMFGAESYAKDFADKRQDIAVFAQPFYKIKDCMLNSAVAEAVLRQSLVGPFDENAEETAYNSGMTFGGMNFVSKMGY